MNGPKIYFHALNISFNIAHKKLLNGWIAHTLSKENKSGGNFNFIFCDDTYLLEINKKYLSHDSYTDIITFDYSENNLVGGDIFISIERVKANAVEYNTQFERELYRVIIHGILHLCGYKDKTKLEKAQMRAKEDFYLNYFNTPHV